MDFVNCNSVTVSKVRILCFTYNLHTICVIQLHFDANYFKPSFNCPIDNSNCNSFAFLRPPLGDLGAMYDDHLRLIGKCVVDFLLVLLRLRRYERISVENRQFHSKGVAWPKISRRRVAPTNHSSSHKTRVNDLSYDMKILPKISIAWVGCTNVTDRRQTDGRRHIATLNVSSRSLKTQWSIQYWKSNQNTKMLLFKVLPSSAHIPMAVRPSLKFKRIAQCSLRLRSFIRWQSAISLRDYQQLLSK